MSVYVEKKRDVGPPCHWPSSVPWPPTRKSWLFSLGVERRAAAEPLVARLVVRQRVPDGLDGSRVAALDNKCRVGLTAFDGLVHVVTPCE